MPRATSHGRRSAPKQQKLQPSQPRHAKSYDSARIQPRRERPRIALGDVDQDSNYVVTVEDEQQRTLSVYSGASPRAQNPFRKAQEKQAQHAQEKHSQLND